MSDFNQLLSRMAGGQGADAQMLGRLQSVLGSEQCQTLAGELTAASPEQLREAVRRGDADEVREAVGQFLNTPEGARLAEQLRRMFGR